MDGEMLPEKWVSFLMVAKPEDTTSQSSWEGKVYYLQKYGECQGAFQSNVSPNGKIREALIYGNRYFQASVVAQRVSNLPAM